jgi:hypothetical protein
MNIFLMILNNICNKIQQSKDCINNYDYIFIIMNVLFINHIKSQCGVYNYGIRLYDIWKKSKKYNIDYVEISNIHEYYNLPFRKYKFYIYNYHVSTMPWLNNYTISKTNINIGILHECQTSLFNYCVDIQYEVPRPIFENIPNSIISTNNNIIEFLNYGVNTDIPIIGSFGFGFTNKGFDKIIKTVNEQFNKAIIKIIMPFAQFGDNNGTTANYVKELCYMNNKNSNIKLMIIHDFLDDNDILYFLSKNTINIFLYDLMTGRGISSTIDFALSTNTPLGISDSYMFRHIYSDDICIYKCTINDCINNDLSYIDKFKTKNSHTNSIKYIETYLDKL